MTVNTAFGRNIKALREDEDLTQTEFGERLGVSTNTVSRWEIRGMQPRRLMLDLIASEFNVSNEDLVSQYGYYFKKYGNVNAQLYSKETGKPISEPITMPIRAAMPAATTLPIADVTHACDTSPAYEVTGDVQWCPPEYAKEGNFYIRVSGDSMNNVLMDGQCALIDTHHEVKSGDIALVKVNGDDATIKRVRLLDGVIFLEPDSTNPAHKRRIIDETDPDSPEVRLIGKVVYAITKF